MAAESEPTRNATTTLVDRSFSDYQYRPMNT